MPAIKPGKFSSQNIVEVGRKKYAVSQRNVLGISDVQGNGIKFSSALRFCPGIDRMSRIQYLQHRSRVVGILSASTIGNWREIIDLKGSGRNTSYDCQILLPDGKSSDIVCTQIRVVIRCFP